MDTQTDTVFMQRAIDLAERGRGQVSPNPLVGAVVVRGGEIVGSGWHQKAGTEHAEIHALRQAGDRARGATLYVTLEPCCHHGKTPPCTDAVRKSGIARVVAAITDPNPLVCGEGAQCLHDNGIEVTIGVLGDAAKKQNEVFLKYIQKKTPFVTLKLAATIDGYAAAADGSSKWITGAEARKHVHRMRAWSDAIMVGSGTVRTDNPSLTVRDVVGTNPRRIIIDVNLESPPDAVAIGPGTIVCSCESTNVSERARAISEKGADIWMFPSNKGRIDLNDVLLRLGSQDITSLLCEGGPSLASSLVSEHLVDKLVYMIAPKLLGNGVRSIENLGIDQIDDVLMLDDTEYTQLGNDMMITGYPRYMGVA